MIIFDSYKKICFIYITVPQIEKLFIASNTFYEKIDIESGIKDPCVLKNESWNFGDRDTRNGEVYFMSKDR